jgi:ADP-ribose pyrophosphatase YjhB (NUDIX family)
MKERFRLVPTSHLILIKGGRILLARRLNTGWMDGKYSVVAGHLDGNETFLQSMIREAKEEAGIGIKTEDLKVVHVMHRITDHERIDLFIQAKKWAGTPRIMEPDKCDDMKWSDLDNLPENTIPYISQAIAAIRGRVFYSEHGWQSA